MIIGTMLLTYPCSIDMFLTPYHSTPCNQLLAWVIGDLDYIEGFTSGDFNGEQVRCRVYAPVGLADQGHYSLDLAVKVRYANRCYQGRCGRFNVNDHSWCPISFHS